MFRDFSPWGFNYGVDQEIPDKDVGKLGYILKANNPSRDPRAQKYLHDIFTKGFMRAVDSPIRRMVVDAGEFRRSRTKKKKKKLKYVPLTRINNAREELPQRLVDFKWKTNATGIQLTNSYTAFGPLNGVAQGACSDERLGNLIMVKKIQIVGYFTVQSHTSTVPSEFGDLIRWGVGINKQTNKLQPVFSEIFEFVTTTNNFRNLNFTKKYEILHTETFQVKPEVIHDGTNIVSTRYQIPFSFYKDLKMKTQFVADFAEYADIVDKSIFIFWGLELGASGVRVDVNVLTRTRYVG